VDGTDYHVVKGQRDFIRRLSSSGYGAWARGVRSVKLVGKFGYADTGSVPLNLKQAAIRLAAVTWGEWSRKAHGVSSMSDSLGNFTRFGAARITDDMLADVSEERRVELYETGEAA
jgi:hypothetical protein